MAEYLVKEKIVFGIGMMDHEMGPQCPLVSPFCGLLSTAETAKKDARLIWHAMKFDALKVRSGTVNPTKVVFKKARAPETCPMAFRTDGLVLDNCVPGVGLSILIRTG